MIPKILHLIWLGPNPYPRIILNQFKKVYSSWSIMIWNESNIPNFNNANYQQMIQAFTGKKLYAALSDIWRLNLLSKYGGVYLDFDFWAIRPFDNLDSDMVHLTHEPTTDFYANFFIAAPRQSPQINHLRHLLSPERILEYCQLQSYCYMAGPNFVTDNIGRINEIPYKKMGVLNSLQARNTKSIPALSTLYPDTYGVHLWNHWANLL